MLASGDRKSSSSSSSSSSCGAGEGDRVPHGVLKYVDDQHQVQGVSTEHAFEGQRSILLGLGAITSATECQLLLDCIGAWNELKAHGCHQLVAIAVDDPFVLKGFRNSHTAPPKVWLKADTKGEFAKSLGMFDNTTGHCKLFAMIVDEGLTIRSCLCGGTATVQWLLDNLDKISSAERGAVDDTKKLKLKESHAFKETMQPIGAGAGAGAGAGGSEKHATAAPHHQSRSEIQDHDKLELEAEHDPAHSVSKGADASSIKSKGQHKQHENRADVQDRDKMELEADHDPAHSVIGGGTGITGIAAAGGASR